MNLTAFSLFEIVYLLLTLFATVMLGFIAVQSWARRHTTGGKTFPWLMTIVALTSLCFAVMAIMQNPDIVFFWAKTRHIGLSITAPLFLLLILELEGYRDWLQPRRAISLFFIPLVVQFVLWFGGNSGLYLASWSTTRLGSLSVEQVTYGDAWRIGAIYSLFCFGVAYLLLISRAWRSPGARRRQALALLIGSFVMGFASLMHGFELIPPTIPNLNPIGFAAGSIFFVVAIFRYNILNLVPTAYDQVFRNLRDPVFVLNNQQIVVAVNPAGLEMLAISEAEIIGMNAAQAFSRIPEILPDDLGLSYRNNEIVAEINREIRSYDLRISTMTQQQKGVGLLVVLHDITERKVANARKFELSIEREKSRLLSSFIQYTSHDLRTPLSKMNLALHILRHTKDEDKRLEKLNTIETEITNMAKIIEELHLLTRLESGILNSQPNLSINQLIRDLPSDIHKLIDEKAITLTYRIAEDLFISGDMELLHYAFQHVLRNALLYTPVEGSITVETVLEKGRWCVIRVNDSGMGIDPKHHHLIFDHFYKVNEARTSDGSGAGLGLAIVKKIAELHHGKISVHSTLGTGSSFELALPIDKIIPSSIEHK